MHILQQNFCEYATNLAVDMRIANWVNGRVAQIVIAAQGPDSSSAPLALWLLLVYAKSTRDNIPGHLLKAVRKEIENAQ